MENEKIVTTIAGILNQKFGLRGIEVLGTGEVFVPENSLIITDKRLIFVVVPLLGAGKLIEGQDISAWQFLLASKDIESKLQEMLSSMNPDEIISSNKRNFFLLLSDLTKVKVSKFFGRFSFYTKDRKKYTYAVRDKKDLEKISQILKDYF